MKQLGLDLATPRPRFGWGGKRAGAGRKRKGPPRHAHGVRPSLASRVPVHVVLRATPEVGKLRRRRAYNGFRRALLRSLARADFRVVHISLQRHHVHLIVEADDRMALSRGAVACSSTGTTRRSSRARRRRGTRSPMS